MEKRISSTSMGQGEQVEGGVLKSLGERNFWSFSSCVIFLRKGKEGWGVLVNGGRGKVGWILGYFEEYK